MNKTKVIATIGPASQDKELLKELILNGMDVARINLSHADHSFCKDIITKINELNEELNTHIAIMLDTSGPNVRIGRVNGEAFLKKGDKIRIYMNDILGDSTKFSVNYPNLVHDVKFNTIIKINDGRVELQVIDKEMDYILCEVKQEGYIVDNKGLNVPGIRLNLPFLSKKDHDDIVFAHKMNVDFLALSFVRCAEDVLNINDKLIELGNDHISIIAKIECSDALEDLDNIISSCDGAMVARGDLSIEIPMERVPGVQKRVISKCHMMGKISIVATELLSSMENTLMPTRAEISDIANAVIDGTDAVMLSGETTIGKYPIETIKVMEKVISSAEEDINYIEFLDKTMRTENQDITGTIAFSVVECANKLKCKAIIAPTISGYTAIKLSRFRPSCPIIAPSPSEATIKKMSLHFGVHGVLVDELKSFDAIVKKSRMIASQILNSKMGDKIIITGGYPFKEVKHTNFMKIEEL